MDTYVQLSKPYLTPNEIQGAVASNVELLENIRTYNTQKQDSFNLIKQLIIRLKLPVKILQNFSYLYQRFYLFNGNFKKYASSTINFQLSIACLFISLKLNDFIIKLNNIIAVAHQVKYPQHPLPSNAVEEIKKVVVNLERKILEFQSFDFRNYLIEDYLIKFSKACKFSPHHTYIQWSITNDTYYTRLILQYPAHYMACVSIYTSKLILNGLQIDTEDFNLKNLLPNTESSFLNIGANQLLEYYIDNIANGKSYLEAAFKELNIPYDMKKFIDTLINIKIEVNKSIKQTPNMIPNDMFFTPRDTEISKVGAMRFLYNEATYLNEVSHYAKSALN